MELSSLLGLNPFPASRWGPEDKPVCVLDGEVHRIRESAGPLRGSAAYVVGVDDRDFESLCARLDVESLHCYEMRVASLKPLTQIRRLRGVAISWNTKLSDIAPLGTLGALTALRLAHTPRVSDLSAIAGLGDYAFLSAALPSTRCEMLAPYLRLAEPLDGKDVMVVGKGKPFLSTAHDGPRLARYVAKFEALRETHRQHPSGE